MNAQFKAVLIFVMLVWAVYFTSWVFPVNQFGLVPRTLSGMTGIVSMPLLHANLRHILANTAPLLILLTLMVASRPKPWNTIVALTLISGVIIWLLARPAIHVGASGLIYALMGFLIVIGIRERRPVSSAIAIGVGVVYGSVIITGIIPGIPGVSWESHLIGLAAGGAYAWLQVR